MNPNDNTNMNPNNLAPLNAGNKNTPNDIPPGLADEMSFNGNCPQCGGTLRPGKAIVNGWSGCDDMGEVCTVSPDPRISKMIGCIKCGECGWSVSAGNLKE